ncbi:hypothetical protein [Streptomyces caatingaensis]|uniref:Uncharacterized protein n=1 Tax=Streptomyces caatingaensis TaxID=1678637 RepID=A0A0K9X9K0_9ACTN|nr:hypothetical protein [Streptomyces caatingaensis]KNB50105.1 hypothetical protein AC230_25735 [Streptomyces caatingaensis]
MPDFDPRHHSGYTLFADSMHTDLTEITEITRGIVATLRKDPDTGGEVYVAKQTLKTEHLSPE